MTPQRRVEILEAAAASSADQAALWIGGAVISDEELTELEDLMSDPEDKHVLKLITPQQALALISEIRRLREENAAWKELNTGLAKFIYSGVYSDSVLNHKALRPGKGGDADAG